MPPAIEAKETEEQSFSGDCLNVIAAHSRRGKRWFIFCV